MQKKQRVKLTCAECNSQFELLPCQMLKGRGQFCSKSCAHKAMQKGRELQCSWCDSSFYRTASEQERAETYFCSILCYQEHRSEFIKKTTYKKEGRRHEHRVVAERSLGRTLLLNEIVHHIDCDKHNNEPWNLAVLPNRVIHGQIHQGKISIQEINTYRLPQAQLMEAQS